MKRLPMSTLEKLCDGLTLLRKYQPTAPVGRVADVLLVGDLNDTHLPPKMKAKMGDLGFKMETDRFNMFAFELSAPSRK